jgi:beta-glucosidase-like glycosyl hydrolase
MLAVFRNARWGRVAESHGEDPLLAYHASDCTAIEVNYVRIYRKKP